MTKSANVPNYCPKCGSDSFFGPEYDSSLFFMKEGRPNGERLIFTCEVCGYEISKPTLDAEELNER